VSDRRSLEREELAMPTKRAYTRPTLHRLGLLRLITQFSF
jgi:hypothetical protein